MNKHIYLTVIGVLFFACTAWSQAFTISSTQSEVSFQVDHKIVINSTVNGAVKKISGKIFFDPKQLNQSYFQAAAQVKSIKTGITLRDNHLMKEEYFYESKFPEILIRSTAIMPTTKSGYFIMKGVLQIKGKQEEISVPFRAQQLSSQWLFTGRLTINRKTFDLGGDNSIGEKVYVDLKIKTQ